MSAVADWFADATGPWLATFVIVVWAITDATQNPTMMFPYDRCIVNAGMALAIARLVHRAKARDQ